ncbi:hypothetical protein, unlikely [Trypanosoma congolense IL3000]|uniref:Uncharacterized protein n=1 Tax=Trypanosoma congolense (strain IL3000) TaxID=1068625 RepID=F9WGX0_TRYCI|nr:hypothetical protein, unlikely [Trypanosoma congolense IL3000]
MNSASFRNILVNVRGRMSPCPSLVLAVFGSRRKISAPGFLKKNSFLGRSGAVSPYISFSISKVLDSSSTYCQHPELFPRRVAGFVLSFWQEQLLPTRRTAVVKALNYLVDSLYALPVASVPVGLVVEYLFAIGAANFSGSRSINRLH